ncbi:hypothetical protein WG947_08530 [Pontibacter sp. H259]|uniref:hypothetical protein n=1 Tax=Pontibacter sp. H259 TaxID=3133421 RepID=UPI0030BF6C12
MTSMSAAPLFAIPVKVTLRLLQTVVQAWAASILSVGSFFSAKNQATGFGVPGVILYKVQKTGNAVQPLFLEKANNAYTLSFLSDGQLVKQLVLKYHNLLNNIGKSLVVGFTAIFKHLPDIQEITLVRLKHLRLCRTMA